MPLESPVELTARLTAFGHKVHALVLQEQSHDGIAGVMLGYGIGMMLAIGGTPQEIRKLVDKTLDACMGQVRDSS